MEIMEYFQEIYIKVVNIVSLSEVCGFILNQEAAVGLVKKDEIIQMKKAVREYEKMV